MYQFPIGVMLESFRLPTPEALAKAAEVGAKGIQMYSTNGEHAPENMTPAKCAELLDMLKSHGLVFSALCGDFRRERRGGRFSFVVRGLAPDLKAVGLARDHDLRAEGGVVDIILRYGKARL